jgi:DNA-binding response OmpR family regulator
MNDEQKKILIVDDDADIRELLNVHLRRNGFDTAFAGDAISALSVARSESPDVILLDLGLPGGEGFTVMERLKAIASLGWIPVIVVSARTDDATRQRADTLGARAYIPKPIDTEKLLEAINAAV